MNCTTCRLLSFFIRRHAALKYSSHAGTEVKQPPSNPFKRLHPWKTLEEFSESLKDSIFFNNDGVIALNKPYGVAVYKAKDKASESYRNRSLVPETKFTVEAALPRLQKYLSAPALRIVKSTDRFSSGVCLLAADAKSFDHLRKCTSKVKSLQVPNQVFWAITLGHPVPESATDKVGLQVVSVENQPFQPDIVWSPSKRQVELKKIKMGNVEHRVLSSNPALRVSLCQVATNTTKFHFVRAYLIRRSVCVIGDTLYSCRLKSILGQHISVSPENCNYEFDPFPSLGTEVVRRLHLPATIKNEMSHLPVMLHQRSLLLPQYFSRKKDLVLTAAPLPHHFSWTCQSLNLATDSHNSTALPIPASLLE